MSLILVRWVLPAILVVAGIVLLLHGGDTEAGAGVVTIGAALMIALFNALLRGSMASTKDREREERARDHYDRFGRWPDE